MVIIHILNVNYLILWNQKKEKEKHNKKVKIK